MAGAFKAGPGLPPLALTMGEPAGIGLDITLETWLMRREHQVPPFYLIGDRDALVRRARALYLDCPIVSAHPETAATRFDHALPVVPCGAPVAGVPGKPSGADAASVIGAIERAVDDVAAGRAAAVVTNPIAKSVLYGAGFGFPGHTEFLAKLAEKIAPGPHRPVMMLVGGGLRVVPATIHVALSAVPELLTSDLIIETARVTAADLQRRFGIKRPRLAIAGLNPHAGEDGALGREDIEVVAPAVAALKAAGIDAVGPLPADTMFHDSARAGYDAAIAMYHDQALIPIKTLAFDAGVNVTLGLPFIRTSPDHGTAFAIAGSGTAKPFSLIAALKLAAELAANEARA